MILTGWWKIPQQLEHNRLAPAFFWALVRKWLVPRNGCWILQRLRIHAEPGTAGLRRLGLGKEGRRGPPKNWQRWGHLQSCFSSDFGVPHISSLTFVSAPFLRTVTEVLVNETDCLGLVSQAKGKALREILAPWLLTLLKCLGSLWVFDTLSTCSIGRGWWTGFSVFSWLQQSRNVNN